MTLPPKQVGTAFLLSSTFCTSPPLLLTTHQHSASPLCTPLMPCIQILTVHYQPVQTLAPGPNWQLRLNGSASRACTGGDRWRCSYATSGPGPRSGVLDHGALIEMSAVSCELGRTRTCTSLDLFHATSYYLQLIGNADAGSDRFIIRSPQPRLSINCTANLY